jgi:carbon-monoxide dehydrogenase large subunit
MTEQPWVGRPMPRKEDLRLVQGKGQYVDDISLPDMVFLQILRSPYPHARITGYDTEAAKQRPGVLAVLTGEDLWALVAPIPHPDNLAHLRAVSYLPLAVERVRFEGEPVVAVVAEDLGVAEDALDDIEVFYESLPPVVTTEAALSDGATQLYDEWDDNVLGERSATFGDVEQAFAQADLVFSETYYLQRQTALPLELRATVAKYDGTDLQVWSSTQTPHLLRTLMGHVLQMPESRIRVIAPDVGGGFGAKYQLHREEMLVPALARLLGRPVKWRENMYEHLAATTQSRDKQVAVQLAVTAEGVITGVQAEIVVDVGSGQAYPSSYGSTLVLAGGLPLGLKAQAYGYRYRCVVTNKAPSGAYRGFGNNMRVFVVERSLDLIAEKLGIDRAEIRRRNLVGPGDLPYRAATGVRMRSGNLTEPLEMALHEADYASLEQRKASARENGRFVGFGMTAFAETAVPSYFGMIGAFGGEDSCTIRMEPDRSVTALVGTAPQGQGHETAFAQVVADQLNVHPEMVTIRHSDTASAPYGLGAWGSRSAVVAGGAAILACEKVKAKLCEIAAYLLDANITDIRWDREGAEHVPTGKVVLHKDLVFAAYAGRSHLPDGMEPGLEANAFFEPPSIDRKPDAEGKAMRHGTVATQAHAVTVEVDIDTGQVRILDYVIVHDCGVIINPALVDGQLRGGLAQGIAGTLFEEIIYDADGHLLTGSLLDYHVPTAREMPPVRLFHMTSPDPTVPGGFKGMAEGGTIGAPAAITNAVADALKPFGVSITSTPLNATRLSKLLLDAQPPG